MKKLESLEKYVLVPNTQFYGTYFYDGEDIELHNEVEEYKNDETGEPEVRLTIIDKIEDGIFKKYKLIEDLKNGGTEETKREFPIKEGEMLIFVMNEGFTKTHSKLIPIDEAIKLFDILRSGDDNDTNGDEKKNSSIN